MEDNHEKVLNLIKENQEAANSLNTIANAYNGQPDKLGPICFDLFKSIKESNGLVRNSEDIYIWDFIGGAHDQEPETESEKVKVLEALEDFESWFVMKYHFDVSYFRSKPFHVMIHIGGFVLENNMENNEGWIQKNLNGS